MTAQRTLRLESDLRSLQRLERASSLFRFEESGAPPDRYVAIFAGKGVHRGGFSRNNLDLAELHRAEIRLPWSYPEHSPDIRWLSPLFHPNVSYSGLVDLADMGLEWQRELGLDVVCERLWDMARWAFVDPERAQNISARDWYAQQLDGEPGRMRLPLDLRPLKDREAASSGNIVHYEWNDRRVELPGAVAGTESDVGGAESAVLYIGEDTPVPQPPTSPFRTPPAFRSPSRPAQEDDGILYIDD